MIINIKTKYFDEKDIAITMKINFYNSNLDFKGSKSSHCHFNFFKVIVLTFVERKHYNLFYNFMTCEIVHL